MEFQVLAKSYNSYGWHATLSLIGDFLLMGSGDFGQAVEELTVTLYLADPGPPKKTLEQLLQRHNSYRSTLPKITYRKAKKQVEIAVASELLVGRKWASSPTLSLPLFERGVDEVCQALSLMRKRFSGADDFDLEGYPRALRHSTAPLPTQRRRPPGSLGEAEGSPKSKAGCHVTLGKAEH